MAEALLVSSSHLQLRPKFESSTTTYLHEAIRHRQTVQLLQLLQRSQASTQPGFPPAPTLPFLHPNSKPSAHLHQITLPASLSSALLLPNACSTARLVTRHIITNALRALCELTRDSELAEPAYPVFAPTELTKLDGEGRSALSLAIQMGNRADVRALLTYGTPFDVAMLHDR
ncbi:MAG: hypothetical protein SGPRY_011369, partial [Prymnesium sp.]